MSALLAICLLASSAPPAGAPIFPLAEIRPGLRGVGHTVFSGTTTEPFDVEIIGVLRDYLGPGLPLIVARLTGEQIEFTGVIAGMSGSPVYIDGKIVGAVGYSFSTFAKEALAGITPIASMTAIPRTLPAPTTARAPLAAVGDALSERAASQRLTPIATPLVITGGDPGVIDGLRDELASDGFEVVLAAGVMAAAGKGVVPTIEPGGPVAAVLVDGDLSIGAVGTATDVRQGQVLAFGHRFMAAGPVEIGLAPAEVVRVVASSRRSFKMANIGAPIGTFFEDRISGVRGVIGRLPAMVPVSITIDDGASPRTIELRVFRDVTGTPSILTLAVASALARRMGTGAGGTVHLSGEMTIAGHESLRFTDVIADEGMPNLAALAAARATGYFTAVWRHPFGPPPMTRLSLTVKVQPATMVEWVEKVVLDRHQVEPGQHFTATVLLRQLNGPVRKVSFRVPVPRGTAPGPLIVHAGDSMSAALLERKITASPELRDLDRYLAYLRDLREPGYLYLQVVARRPSLSIGTGVLHDVPGSFVLRARGGGDENDGVSEKSIVWEERTPRLGSLQGLALTDIKVIKR